MNARVVGAAAHRDILGALPAIPAAAAALPAPRSQRRGPATAAMTVAGSRIDVDVDAVADALAHTCTVLSHASGASTVIRGRALLAERELLAASPHLPGTGRSLRGATTLTACADGWLAINLAREEDRDCLPALTHGVVDTDGSRWAEWLSAMPATAVLERARLLGLAVGILPPAPPVASPFSTTVTACRPARAVHDITVVDFSRLWAGPLAGALLAEAGARVVRIVDETSPPPVDPDDRAFDLRLNGAKEDVVIDVRDRATLTRIIDSADVVITSMRPSALERFPAPSPAAIHLAITAHGTTTGADRVGFGDDCAVEGGLVAYGRGRPEFLGDAIADPLTGLLAATAALGMLAAGRSGRVDLALSRTAAWVAGMRTP